METTRINTLTESVKRQDSTIKLLTTEKYNLIKINNQNKKEREDMSKIWTNKLKVKETEADNYRNKCEEFKSENQKLTKELNEMKKDIKELNKTKDQKKEIQSLKQQRKYFEDHNNHHVSFK